MKMFIEVSFSLHTAAVAVRVVGERSSQVIILISLISIVCMRYLHGLWETGKHGLCERGTAAHNFFLFILSGNARAQGPEWDKVFVVPHATRTGGLRTLGWPRRWACLVLRLGGGCPGPRGFLGCRKGPLLCTPQGQLAGLAEAILPPCHPKRCTKTSMFYKPRKLEVDMACSLFKQR